ncbi:MAG: hypothetical protein A3H44_11230 [Gammaproteobacteria bacterium RIFCSPLOWO2_02_FULL_57_10]|nr:MAG: hypothetical protein A3H44_11230 [Gammaproteobacteria bacterium RIFCSPLOWO2_02_FULL_57_10]
MVDPFESHHENVAASFQKGLEEKVLQMCRILEQKSTARHLVIAGEVSLNSVMNGRILTGRSLLLLHRSRRIGDRELNRSQTLNAPS